MDYEKVKKYLLSIGAELLTEAQFAERWRAVMDDEDYMRPYGCLACGQAYGFDDFTDVLFAVYPKHLPDDRDKEINWQTLGVSDAGGIQFTSIGRCKFCGACDIHPDY